MTNADPAPQANPDAAPPNAVIAGVSPAAALRPPTFFERLAGNLRPRAWMGNVPGPVFQKEVWIINKRLSTSWIRLVYALVLLGIVSIAFLSIALSGVAETTYVTPGGTYPGQYSGQVTSALQKYQQVAPIVTITIAWTQFVLLSIIACAFGAPAICDEKRAGTLGTLLATPVTAWQIILGKLLGRCVELGILLLIGAPLLLSLRTFGGVPGSFIVAILSLTAVTVLVASQLSILMSIRAKRSGTAFFAAIVLLMILLVLLPLGLFAGTMLLAQVAGAMGAGAPPWWIKWIFVTSSPAVMMFTSIELMAPGAPFFGWGGRTWIPCVLSLLGIWALLFTLSAARLRRTMLVEAGGAVPVLTKKQRKAIAKAASAGTPQTADAAADANSLAPDQPGTKKKRRASSVREGISREVGDPSIQWREMQFRVMNMSKAGRWIALAALSFFCLFLYWISEMHEAMFIFMAYVLFFFLIIAACNVNATSIAGEREGRTLDVLLCAPVSSGQIIWQKYLGGLYRMRVFLLFFLAHFTIFIFGTPISWLLRNLDYLVPKPWGRDYFWTGYHIHVASIPLLLLIIVPPVCFLIAVSTLLSTFTQRSTRASVLTLMVAAAMWLGAPLFLAVMAEITRTWNDLRDISVLPNPFVMLGPMMAELANKAGRNVNLGQATIDLPHGHVNFYEYVIILLVIAIVYFGLTFLTLRWAASILRNRAEKK